MAKENGQIDKKGDVWTTVYIDGGWSKRSYGHNYNAASGVGVIIGQFTKQLLYIGVRNKYCCVCARYANRQEMPKQHVCYKNWDVLSPAMESDIIVEGFRQSMEMHNLK
ncbi:unnamed protein product [Psylliodes chrysocephalus]|uniref:Mutator-like transposase domain-containing protein n=1 Tax=Psylliodes chrysocephalus TaxID=3402493 RepID=A0A9P0G9M2_9CUCU|nr:unnamed protein product [Psylliodes chrysocephala]